MKQIIFTQSGCNPQNLYPFSLSRKVQDMRVGILTIREKWETILLAPSLDLEAENELPQTYPTINLKDLKDNTVYYLIRGNLLPSIKLLSVVKKLKPGEAIMSAGNGSVLMHCLVKEFIDADTGIKEPSKKYFFQDFVAIEFPWHIFQRNKEALLFDYQLLSKGKKSAALHSSNQTINRKNIFAEQDVHIKNAIINADDGPVYIGKNALVMEGCCLRGPVSIGERAVVKMGTKIYGATTIGPGCTVGGEIKNSVLFANSNKAHDGYLGDSVIGEWCNLGAGTSNSNLKNTAGNIIVHLQNQDQNAGIRCGVMIGDFSRTAINTSINSGTVIGISANVFGNGLTPKHIPSFSWGFNNKVKYKLDKALADANEWKKLKNKELNDTERLIFKSIFKQTK